MTVPCNRFRFAAFRERAVIAGTVVGRWHQYAKSGFKRKPTEMFDRQWPLMV
jgi:hypothetical protein